MMVEEGITIEIFEVKHHHQNHHHPKHHHDHHHAIVQEGKSIDRIVLNEAATGGISGSKLSPDDDELEVNEKAAESLKNRKSAKLTKMPIDNNSDDDF